MDEAKLKEARTNLIDQVVTCSKSTDVDLHELDELLKTIERIDQLLQARRSTP